MNLRPLKPTAPSYFADAAQRVALRAAAAQLLGTPFFPNSEAPGRDGGIDCVRTLNWLYRTCGAIARIEIPRQTMDHGHHSDRSLLIEAFETWPELVARFACVWRCDPEVPPKIADLDELLIPGDALCFIAGKVPHHGGVFLEHREFLHTLRRYGVHTMQLDAIFRGWSVLGRLAAIYRPLPR